MYLFTLIALPAFCLGTYFMHAEKTRKAYLPPVIAGFISAVLYCFIEAFFILTDYICTENISSVIVHLFLTQTLIPSAVITILFFIFSKDSPDYKFDCILPLLSSFNSVFIPYKIFTSGNTKSFFPLFEKIILYLALLIFVYTFIKKAFVSLKNKSSLKGIIFILLTIIALLVPAVQEALWYFKISTAVRLIISSAYLILAIFVFLKLTVIEFKE